MENVDEHTVAGFGAEWTRFDQSRVPDAELESLFERYFAVFPWESLPAHPVGFDLGCGSGRWARFVAPRVRQLHCIDASAEALAVARRNLAVHTNCRFHHASVADLPLDDASMDFGYSLGVLHHVPDTLAGLRSCVEKLKPGAPFLAYLYYAFDNQPTWYQLLWRTSDFVRRCVSRAPERVRYIVSQVIALLVYLPLARTARALARRGGCVNHLPLSAYRDASFYTMRTDALDRLGTRLERRFTADEIRDLFAASGLVDVEFNDTWPYWCVVGRRAA